MNEGKTNLRTKKVTIDDLAIMIAKGFKGVDSRFEGLEQRMDSLEYRMDSMEQKMDSLELKMEGGFNRLQNQIDNITLNYTTLREHDLLKTRVTVLEKKPHSSQKS